MADPSEKLEVGHISRCKESTSYGTGLLFLTQSIRGRPQKFRTGCNGHERSRCFPQWRMPAVWLSSCPDPDWLQFTRPIVTFVQGKRMVGMRKHID